MNFLKRLWPWKRFEAFEKRICDLEFTISEARKSYAEIVSELQRYKLELTTQSEQFADELKAHSETRQNLKFAQDCHADEAKRHEETKLRLIEHEGTIEKNMGHMRKMAIALAIKSGISVSLLLLSCLTCFGQTGERNIFTTNPPPLLSSTSGPMLSSNNNAILIWTYNANAFTNLNLALATNNDLFTSNLLWMMINSITNQLVPNNLDTNPVGLAPADHALLQSVGGVPQWTSTITVQVQNWSDTAAHIDTNVWPLGVDTDAYDGQRNNRGDGSTLGGIPVGFRSWPTPTNAFLAGGRAGEHAFSVGGFTHLATAPQALPGPILWINPVKGTNWVPFVIFPRTNNYPSLINESLLTTAFFSLDPSTNGAFFDAFAISSAGGNAGNIVNSVNIAAGGGGNAFDNTDTSIGGPGGDVTSAILVAGGHGGNATGAGGAGGAGGGVVNSLQFIGGNGGNDAFGNGGGIGAPPGQFFVNGGNGADATVASAGGNGGGGGGLVSLGGNAVGINAGGAGGKVTMSASTTNGGGNVMTAATTGRNGGNLSTFQSSYAPATIFTTTTTAGPSASASEVSLLGTAAFLAPVTGQASGKILASNVVDHAGRTLTFSAGGFGSTNGTTATLEIKVKIGSTNVLDTGPVTLASLGTGNQTWQWTGQVTFRTTGASAQFLGFGTFLAPGNTIFSTNTVIGTVDTTKDETIDCTAQFNQSDTLQCTTARFDLVN